MTRWRKAKGPDKVQTGSLASEEEARTRGIKKMIERTIKTLMLVFLLMFFATSALAAIAFTAHDLSSLNTTPGFLYRSNEPEICVFCHTPHGGNLTGPLWNKPVPAAGAFTFYRSSDALKVELNSVTSVNDESLLCLACHDGSIAVNNLLNFGLTGAQPFIPPTPGDRFIMGTPGANRRIGGWDGNVNDTGHLEDDHPISLNYAQAQSDNPTGLTAIGSVDPAIRFFGGNRLECSSCHDVHDNSIPPFLNKDNTGSALCLSCHIK